MFYRIYFYYKFYNLLNLFSDLVNIDYVEENLNNKGDYIDNKNINDTKPLINDFKKENNNEKKEILIKKLEDLKQCIECLGFLGIKFTQFFISKIFYEKEKIFIVNYFRDIFDNCPAHDFEYTKEIFKKDFGENLHSYVDINSMHLFASGSIGQVYRCNKLSNGEEIAIKVKHPKIKNDLYYFNSLINLLKFIQKIPYFKRKFKLLFNFDEFRNHLVNQSDFSIEAKHCEKFYNDYEDNKFIIIPKVIKHTDRILISTFEDGIDFTDVSNYNKSQIILNFICFNYNSALIKNYIHGDLHIKNWKIRELTDKSEKNNNKKYALVIYDFGLCFNTSDVYFNRKLLQSVEKLKIDSSIDFQEVIEKSIDKKFTDSSLLKLNSIINKYTNEGIDFTFLAEGVLNIVYEEQVKSVKNDVVNILIFLSFIQNFIVENVDVSVNGDICFIKNQINLISFCKVNNIYKELREYMENNVLNNNITKNNFFNNGFNLVLKSPE